jgi:hypothetical protein
LRLFGLDSLVLPESLQQAVQHGEVFTRRWVVETILDMVGYTADHDLADTSAPLAQDDVRHAE